MKKQQSKYDVFISYRRAGSFETASLVAERIKNAGFRVFFDIESLKSGRFNEQLYDVIEQCTDFILVLPENGIDRCHQKDDWVRLEVLCALKHKKNIIPIKLRGFEWPVNMPEDMEELPNYQAITASDHQYFDASIEKLKSYLKSKPGITWRKHKKVITSVLAVVIVALAIVGIRYYNEQKLLARICEKETILMGTEVTKMHIALLEASDTKAEWDKFQISLATANPKDTAFIRKQFVDFVDAKTRDIPKLVNRELPAESSSVLLRHGIKPEEIDAFYTMMCPSFMDEVNKFMEKLKIFARMPLVSESIAKNIKLNYDALYESAKGDFYGYLGFLTTLPKSVYSDDFYKLRSQLLLFRDIPVNKTYQEYESDQEGSLNAYRDIVIEIGSDLKKDELMIEGMKHTLEQNKKDFQDAVLSEKVASINLKKQALDEKRAEVAKKQSDLDEAYKRVLTKCSFTSNEDQWTMWGKILRLSTVARNTMKLRKEEKAQLEINRQEAIRKGLDPNSLSEPSYPVSVDELFNEIYKRIDLFVQYNQDKDLYIKEYAPVAKQYFKMLRAGEIEDSGILVFGTENKVQHPVLKPGDIVVERKGKPVYSADDYFKLKDDPAPNLVKIVRLNPNGTKSIQTVTMPDTQIKVGFMNLRETE
jgi:hypothetical protein